MTKRPPPFPFSFPQAVAANLAAGSRQSMAATAVTPVPLLNDFISVSGTGQGQPLLPAVAVSLVGPVPKPRKKTPSAPNSPPRPRRVDPAAAVSKGVTAAAAAPAGPHNSEGVAPTAAAGHSAGRARRTVTSTASVAVPSPWEAYATSSQSRRTGGGCAGESSGGAAAAGIPALNDFISVGPVPALPPSLRRPPTLGEEAEAHVEGRGVSSSGERMGGQAAAPRAAWVPLLPEGYEGGEAWWGPLYPPSSGNNNRSNVSTGGGGGGCSGDEGRGSARHVPVQVPAGCPPGYEALLCSGLEGLLSSDLADMGLTWEQRPWWRAVDQVCVCVDLDLVGGSERQPQ